MILDRIENHGNYTCLNGRFERAFKFLLENNLEELPVGRYEIDGDNIFAMVQEYTTKSDDETKWETHQNYIDIQYVVKGNEAFGWMPVSQLAESESYLVEKDVAFYMEVPTWNKIDVQKDSYVIFFPNDGHKPSGYISEPRVVKKIVIKVKL